MALGIRMKPFYHLCVYEANAWSNPILPMTKIYPISPMTKILSCKVWIFQEFDTKLDKEGNQRNIRQTFHHTPK